MGRHKGFSAKGTTVGIELTFGAPPNEFVVEVGDLGPVYNAYEKIIEYANSVPA